MDATLKALTAYSGPVHLILGGSLKGASFDSLAAATEGLVKEAILIGAAGAGTGRGVRAPRRCARRASHSGRPEARPGGGAVAMLAAPPAPGDVVLLSPACASFDHYRNFEHRGEHFIELVARLESGGSLPK